MEYYEKNRHRTLTDDSKICLAKHLTRSQAFDNFLAKKFATVKRYGAEGAESMMAVFDEILMSCGANGIEEVVIGMPHRGRLNVLTGLLGVSKDAFFHKVSKWIYLIPIVKYNTYVLVARKCRVFKGCS